MNEITARLFQLLALLFVCGVIALASWTFMTEMLGY